MVRLSINAGGGFMRKMLILPLPLLLPTSSCWKKQSNSESKRGSRGSQTYTSAI